MKATPSKDGDLRFTVRVPFRIGREEIENAIAYVATREEGYRLDCAPNKAMAVESALRGLRSRRACFAAVEKACSDCGDTYWTWAENHVSQTVATIVAEQVRVIVEKVFPEFKQTKPISPAS